jgi:hypothetical protein
MALINNKIPTVVVAQRVMDKIANAASQYLADETGEAMVGLVVVNKETNTTTIYVLDTISPDESAVREVAMFGLGDAYQRDVYVWLMENWEACRAKRCASYGQALQAKWNVPLQHLGDWHKQPGFMIKPSMGDLMTALDILDEEGRESPFLLVPIVTLGHPSSTINSGASVNYLTVPMGDDSDLRIDFWYIHRHLRMFQPVDVTIIADDQVPGLTQYSWHLTDEDRYVTETAQMRGDGLFLSVIIWEADGKLPLEICFAVARQGSNKVLIIVTPWDYPLSKPYARIAPFIHLKEGEGLSDVFDDLWENSTIVKEPAGWHWSEDRYLIDYVHAIEDSLGLRPDEPKTPPGTSVIDEQPIKDSAADDDDMGDVEPADSDIDGETVR